MEKDSFEEQLRNKIFEAELTKNPTSNKEEVWNAVQKKTQPQRKFYYAAAAILFIIGIGSIFYNKNDEAVIPIVASLPKPLIVLPERDKQKIAPVRKVEIEQLEVVKQIESAVPRASAMIQKEEPLSAILPVADNVVVAISKNISTENKVVTAAPVPMVPEFTVQLKRGVAIADNTDENIIITSLKKFKLKRDTTYFANAEQKQPTKIRLTFKKEN